MSGRRWQGLFGLKKVFCTACVLGLMTAGIAFAGGNLRVASMGEPASLDPHKVSGTWENYIGLPPKIPNRTPSRALLSHGQFLKMARPIPLNCAPLPGRMAHR